MERAPFGDGPPLASLGQRLLGQFLDGLVGYLGVIAAIVLGTVSETLGNRLILPSVGFLILYLLLADGLKNGQSLGKRLLKTAVVDATSGEPCGFGKSFLRNVLMILGIFDWAFIFGEKRQRLGDIAANTVVIRLTEP